MVTVNFLAKFFCEKKGTSYNLREQCLFSLNRARKVLAKLALKKFFTNAKYLWEIVLACE